MRDEDVQREIDRAVESKTTTGWRKRQISKYEDDDIQEYTRPWVGLTDEDMGFLFPHGKSAWVQEIVKIIEAKLKERNHG